MELELNTRSTRLLEAFVKHAPKMELCQAYNFVREHQQMDNDLSKYEFIIMQFLTAMGVDGNGHLRDKEMADKLKDMPDEFWMAYKSAINVHAGFSCSPFTDPNWMQKQAKKLNIKPEDLQFYKESVINISKEGF